MQNRGYAPEECIAVGDSREDLEMSQSVGTFWLVANALERDPDLAAVAAAAAGAVGGRRRVRVASAEYGAGVYEAVVTTLAER
jgi:phosphoserine phosphatase